MKLDHATAFEKHLHSDKVASLYLVITKDEFEKETMMRGALSLLKKRGANTKIYDAESLELRTLTEDLESLSLFSEKSVIAIRRGENLKKTIFDRLTDYLSRPNETVTLLIFAEQINKSTSFYKTVNKEAVILELPEVKAWKKGELVIQWLQSLFVSENKRCDYEALCYLTEHTGDEKAKLYQEVQKLLCYIGDRAHITVADVVAICSDTHLDNAWKLGDAILEKDPKGAIKVAKALLTDGYYILQLVAQMRSQIHNAFRIFSIFGESHSVQAVKKVFPYMTERMIERKVRIAANYGDIRFREALISLEELERNAKQSNLDPEFLLEKFLINITRQA